MALNLIALISTFLIGVVLYYITPFLPITALLVTLLSVVFVCRLKVLKTLSCLLSIALGLAYTAIVDSPYSKIEELIGKNIEITFVCRGCAEDSSHAFLSSEELLELRELDTGKALKVRYVKAFFNSALFDGYLYRAKGQVAKDTFYLNPGVSNQALKVFIKEITSMTPHEEGMRQSLRRSVNRKIEEALSEDVSSFIKAIVTGDRSGLSEQTREAFQKTGLAHILSISGAHFGLLIFIVFKFFKALCHVLPESWLVRLTLYVTPNHIAAVCSFPVVVFYLMLSPMNYPSVRAFIMIVVFLIGLIVERRQYLPHSILISAFIITVLEPSAVTELSFQLSFLAVMSIAIALNLIGRSERKDQEPIGVQPDKETLSYKILRMVREPILVTLSATVGTTVVVAYYFQYVSLISPLTNLIITPVIGFLILPVSILSALCFLVTGWFALSGFIETTTDWVLKALVFLSNLQWTSISLRPMPLVIPLISVVSVLACFALLFMTVSGKRKMVRLCLVLAILTVPYLALLINYALTGPTTSVTFLDVGQGDSAVVELPDKRVIVVDTGKNGFALSRYLRYRGIKTIDALALSHPQRDHAGGLARVVSKFEVLQIWDNGWIQYPKGLIGNIQVQSLQRGDLIKGDGYSILVLHPHDGFIPERGIENNLSLVLKLTIGKVSFLLTGDIEQEAISDLLHAATALKSTVLKFPHHGSLSSFDQYFIRLVDPDFVVLSAGRQNPYRFPHRAVIEAFADKRVFRTDIDGAIRFELKGQKDLSVLTAREYSIKPVKTLKDELINLRLLFEVW